MCLSEEKGLCNKENVRYSIKCKTYWDDEDKKKGPIDKRTYIMDGETNRTARIRYNEHRVALEKRDKSNLWDHCVMHHQGEEGKFEYKADRGFHRDSLLKQIDEVRKY